MSYMLLIVEDPSFRRGRTPEARQQAYDKMMAYGESLRARGVYKASDSLAVDAVRVQSRAGKTRVSDGPFAEAKELVGGFFLLDVDTLDRALELAAECPATEWATVEVRQVQPCFMP